MRKIVCIEGNDWLPGQYLLPGSIKWPEERVPVTDSNWPKDTMKILGQAKDFQRDPETGEISVDVTLVDHSERFTPILPDLSFTIYANDVEWGEDEEHGKTVETATIRHIFVYQDAPWGRFGGPALPKEPLP